MRSLGDVIDRSIIAQLNCNNVQIDLFCKKTQSKYDAHVSVSCHEMRYVWHEMPPHSTLKDLLNKLNKVYDLNLQHIEECNNLSTQIIGLTNTLHSRINKLMVHFRDNDNYTRFNDQFAVDTFIHKNANINLLKIQLSKCVPNIHCPLQCVLDCANHRKVFNDIPNKKEIIQFIQTMPNIAHASNILSMDILLPSLIVKIHHKCDIFWFYAFKNMLFLYSHSVEIGSKIINDKYTVNYNDILQLLDVNGYTFGDPNHRYFELDLYESIVGNTKNIIILHTKRIQITQDSDSDTGHRCVICQENVSDSHFTRIDCCSHIYHYECMRQYLEYIHQNSQYTTIFNPLCPLCRKPFTVIQVHNNLILQKMEINSAEFKPQNTELQFTHLLQYSDITNNSLFSDEENEGNYIVGINSRESQQYLSEYLSPNNGVNMAELDEFYRMGLSLINTEMNGTESTAHMTETKTENHSSNRESISSYSDRIGRLSLSLSNVSTSATVGTQPIRPSLRYIYSPLPYDTESPPSPTTKLQINPYNIMETKTISLPFSDLSSSSTNINTNHSSDEMKGDDIPNSVQSMRLCPIDSLQSIQSNLL